MSAHKTTPTARPARPATPSNWTKEDTTGPEERPAGTPAGPANPEQTMNVTEDDIRRLAYQRWEEAGSPDGDGTEFWLQAERELKHAFHD